jgi:hypothetical protein
MMKTTKRKTTMKAKDISTGMKFNSWEIMNRIKNKGTIPYFVCKCDCGTIKEVSCSNLVGSLSKSCGCVGAQKQRDKIIHELDGKTFGDLTVIGFEGVDKFQKTLWKCKCLCGNFKTIRRNALVTGNTKTCGCSHGKEKAGLRNRIDISGQKFGKLTVINYSHSIPNIKNGIKKSSTAYWDCICDCGNTIAVSGLSLRHKYIVCCGTCQLRKNGVKTSSKALELNKMIGKGIHNYKTKSGPCIDIALSYNGQKVGIEYDEWYWHGGRQKEDAVRIQKLLECGWKIIQIKASKNLPTVEQMNEALNALNNVNHYIIQLPNWGTRKYFKQGEEDVD